MDVTTDTVQPPRMQPTFNRMLTGTRSLFASIALLSLVIAPAVSGQSYTVTNLGTLGGNSGSSSLAISPSGVAVGYASISGDAEIHATRFSGTGSNNFDLGGLAGAPNSRGEAHGMNSSGQIAGYATSANGWTHGTRFTGTGSGNTDLGTLGGNVSLARAINNSGQIVGSANDAIGTQAVLYGANGSGNISLGSPGLYSSAAYGINNLGQIVGLEINSQQAERAMLFSTAGNQYLGTLGGFNSTARDINDSGQIVGGANNPGNRQRATLYSGTGSNNIDLGTLGGDYSIAYSINNSGQIVGDSSTSTVPNATIHGFIYSNGTMRNLNSLVVPGSGMSDIRFLEAGRPPGKCINDAGQIAATASEPIAGRARAVLLNPVVLSGVAVSRKTHGTATYDINLPLSGAPGVECRTGGLTNDYQIVVTFAAPVTFGGTAFSSGTGSIVSATGSGTSVVSVNLTGVTNQQRLAVTLSNVSDGVNTRNIVVPMGILAGDTNGSGAVTASDIAQTKGQSGQPVTGANFRTDVNASGTMSSSDTGLVKAASGTQLAP